MAETRDKFDRLTAMANTPQSGLLVSFACQYNGANQRSASYTAGRLNRYSSRTVPATFDVLGLATATSAVTVHPMRELVPSILMNSPGLSAQKLKALLSAALTG